MAEAAVTLSSNRATQKMLRHRSAVMILARMRAKKSVLLELRARGLKPQHFCVREIAVLTDYYLNQHRAKLMAEAAEAIATWWPGFAQWRVPPGRDEVFVKSTKIEHSPNADSAVAVEIANG
jgi:hypothetical protein